jgi:hypothetical protein
VESPAPLFKPFNVCITITNLGDEIRDLTILMDAVPQLLIADLKIEEDESGEDNNSLDDSSENHHKSVIMHIPPPPAVEDSKHPARVSSFAFNEEIDNR